MFAQTPSHPQDGETYLEYLLDAFSNTQFSHLLSRFMAHLSSLDATSCEQVKSLSALESKFIAIAQDRIRDFPLLKTLDDDGQLNAAMIPETSELLGVISSDKEAKELREDIDKARTKATMIAEEKIQTAEQAYSLVRDQTDRLDRIIMDFEAYLHQENLFDDPDGDDEGMSGGGVQQLQQQWQQQQYQPQQQQQQQQQYQQQQQQWDQPPVPSNGIFSSYSAETQYSNSISNNNSNRNSNSNNNNSINNNNNNSSNNNNNNSSNNNNAPPSSPPPNQLNKFGFRRPVETETVAINVEESEWIVAKVISSDLLNETLKLQDADVEASHKQYTLPEERVRTLFFSHFNSVNNASTLKLSRGEIIMAVYPDTTSFYEATVAKPAKIDLKSGAGGVVEVNFKDDHDEFGIIPERPVFLHQVLLL